MDKLTRQNFLRHGLAQTLATGGVGLISFSLTIYLAGRLGATEFGIYQYLFTVGAFASLIQDFGFKTLIFRELSSSSDDLQAIMAGLGPVLLIHLVVSTLIIVLLGFVFRGDWLISLAALFFSCSVAGNWISAYLKGRGRFELEAAWRLWFRLATATAVIIFCLAGGFTTSRVIVALAAGGALALLICLPRLRDYDFSRFALLKQSLRLYHQAAPLLFIDMFTLIYFRSDIIMLGWLSDYKQVGQYSVAYRFVEGLIILATPILHILFRRLRMRWRDRDQFLNLFRRSLFVILGAAMVICLAGLALSEDLVRLLLGANYSQSAHLLDILLLVCLFILPNYLLTQSALALGLERVYAWITAALAGMNITLNLAMIPIYGAAGAAWSTVATEMFLLAAMAYVLAKKIKKIQ